jgi:1,4-alpha-glucan branching enzyme
MSVGSFCLVLHGHLPYVLRHGTWPHGEDWLYEAAAETYLPLLSTIRECEFLNGNPRLTIGLTPILLEQLAHEDFKAGFERYLADRRERARSDRGEFEGRGESHFAHLAGRWEELYGKLADQFSELGRDIPAAYAQCARQGLVEILTSSATHAYLPLLYEDSSVHAQLRAGTFTSQRILGFKPKGVWLPECAYRPPGPWHAPIPWGQARNRPGSEHFVASAGLTHFFVEHQLFEHSRSEWVNNGSWQKVDWQEASKYPTRGWRSVQEPALVASDGTGPGHVVGFARDPLICEKVWSGDIGYPGNGVYLEFHKKQGERRGLRYWKVTSRKFDLGGKQPYYPQDIPGKIHEHVSHFCTQVRQRLWEYHHRTGRHGVVVASFDAELFGHWWFEGPQFLRDVILSLNADPDVDLCTTAEFLERHPPDKAVALPEGSWGDGGDHRVWVNDRVKWIWEVEYRLEGIFGKLTYNLPWRQRADLREILEKLGRELLLLQASDWPFVIARDQAVDYGIKRFMQHAGRFESLADIAEKLNADSGYLNRMSEVERFELRDTEIHDVVFPNVDLNWWNV